jgi:hypothetical protein
LIVESGGDNINVEERRGRCNIAAALEGWFSCSKKKYERSRLSLNEHPVRILSGRSLSVRETHSHLWLTPPT